MTYKRILIRHVYTSVISWSGVLSHPARGFDSAPKRKKKSFRFFFFPQRPSSRHGLVTLLEVLCVEKTNNKARMWMFQTVIEFDWKNPPPGGVSPGGFLECGACGTATEQLLRAHSNGVDQHHEEKYGAPTMGSESKLKFRSDVNPELEDNRTPKRTEHNFQVDTLTKMQLVSV